MAPHHSPHACPSGADFGSALLSVTSQVCYAICAQLCCAAAPLPRLADKGTSFFMVWNQLRIGLGLPTHDGKRTVDTYCGPRQRHRPGAATDRRAAFVSEATANTKTPARGLHLSLGGETTGIDQ